MPTVTVSDKGQVVIPINIRKQLGIKPGCKLLYTLDGDIIRLEMQRSQAQTNIDEGFGMLVCPMGKTRHLRDFDVVQAMKDERT